MPNIALSRRRLLAGSAALALLARTGTARAVELSEDGLHQQPWFLQSFLNLKEDLRGARAAGKTFVVLWELKGCPYCKLLHTVNFANPRIASYAQENFDFLQLNIIGSRAVTDFDGTELPEKALAVRYRVSGTPTLLFFVEDDASGAREVARTKYREPAEFLGMLRFVREKGYETTSFDEWLRANPQQT
jgi:thioredoxin-related protein